MRHGSHSRPGDPGTGVVSRLDMQRSMAATHRLESQGQESSAGLKSSKAQQPLTNWRAEDRHRQQASNAARHGSHPPTGESRTGVVSRLQTQRGTSTHSLPGEPRTCVVSRVETQRGAAPTHLLESRGQESSAGLKHGRARQSLTCWRAEDRQSLTCWRAEDRHR